LFELMNAPWLPRVPGAVIVALLSSPSVLPVKVIAPLALAEKRWM